MSQVGQTAPSNATEGYPVTNLTLVVLLLIPCVVILLLLNCLFLGYKFLILSRRKTGREEAEEMPLQSAVQRVRLGSDVAFLSLQDERRALMSLSEPVLSPRHPVTSSRASSRERGPQEDHRIRLLRPDGATGSGSLRAPSTIRATSSAADFTTGLYLLSSRTHSAGKAGWCKSAPVLPQSSESEAETAVNRVPPNSPMETEHVAHLRRSSRPTYEMLADVNPGVAALVFDKVDAERDYISPPSEASCPNVSAVGPGLDSDFGASAGVSLRILSDSEGQSNGVVASALEWDYYDPCYVKQNNVPKHKHHRPAVHTKQYWV